MSLIESEVISLTFRKFALEPDTYCSYNLVHGAMSNDTKALGKFCGDTALGPISSEGNELFQGILTAGYLGGSVG